MTARRYSTPPAFKQALEKRLRNAAESGRGLRSSPTAAGLRPRSSLASGHVLGEAVTLKGGLVIELRLARARTTKDVDLRVMRLAGGDPR